jgi:hypothetical protein
MRSSGIINRIDTMRKYDGRTTRNGRVFGDFSSSGNPDAYLTRSLLRMALMSMLRM